MSGRQCPMLWSERTLTSYYAVRFLDLIKPFTPLLPEVAAPETSKTPFNQKLMWTGVSIPGRCPSAVITVKILMKGPSS